MENKVLGAFTAIILVVVIAMSCLLIYVPNMHIIALKVQDSRLAGGRVSVMEMLKDSEEELQEDSEEIVQDVLKGHQIRLTLPKNVTSAGVSIINDYVNKNIAITINGIGKDYFSKYPMRGNADNIVDVTYDSENLIGVIEITLDDVKEVQMSSEGEYIYFDFLDPHDVYDYVVVVDAGHGGNVPGATKLGVKEKDLDLHFVLQLKRLFDHSGKNIGVYYTRTDDSNPSFESRVGLANDSEADIFLSIHNNSTASGRMSSINGTEVMYKGADTTGESKRFATLCLDKLLGALESRNKGTVVGDEVYIIRMSEAPVALVEVGFMTNSKELEKLQDNEYQKKAASALYDAVVSYLYEN